MFGGACVQCKTGGGGHTGGMCERVDSESERAGGGGLQRLRPWQWLRSLGGSSSSA